MVDFDNIVKKLFKSIFLWRFIKFGIVGVSGIFVNQMLLFLLSEYIKLDYRLSSIVAIECAIINNFIFNSIWTWKDRYVATFRTYLSRLFKFNISSGLTSFIFNWTVLVVLTEFIQMNYLYANLIGIALASIVNFIINNFWTFSAMKIEDNLLRK